MPGSAGGSPETRGSPRSSLTCMVVGGALRGLSHLQGGWPGLLTRWQHSKKARAEAAKPLGSLALGVALLLQPAFADSEWGKQAFDGNHSHVLLQREVCTGM